MARGRGGIRTGAQFEGLPGPKQERFEGPVLDAADLLVKREADTPGEALRTVLGRKPSGADYAEFYDLGGRTRQDWQRLYRGTSPPVIAPDGVYDLAPNPSWT